MPCFPSPAPLTQVPTSSRQYRLAPGSIHIFPIALAPLPHAFERGLQTCAYLKPHAIAGAALAASAPGQRPPPPPAAARRRPRPPAAARRRPPPPPPPQQQQHLATGARHEGASVRVASGPLHCTAPRALWVVPSVSEAPEWQGPGPQGRGPARGGGGRQPAGPAPPAPPHRPRPAGPGAPPLRPLPPARPPARRRRGRGPFRGRPSAPSPDASDPFPPRSPRPATPDQRCPPPRPGRVARTAVTLSRRPLSASRDPWS
jgi:hypothetical protein